MSRLDPRELVLTAGGLGHCRPMPGTWGSTPPPAIALLLGCLLGTHWTIEGVLLLLALMFTIGCIRFGRYAEERFGRKDPSQVVADEVAGQSIALLFLPWVPVNFVGTGEWLPDLLYNATLAGIAFVTFRVADVIKPPPARGMQRLEGGLGIVIDDLFAGVYALLLTQVIVRTVLPGVW